MYSIFKLCQRPSQASKHSMFEQKFLGATEPSEPQYGFRTRRYTHSTASKPIFSLTLLEKKKITRKNTPVGFYFECFKFYPQLRCLFQDSGATQDGLPSRAGLLWRGMGMLKCHGVCQGDTGAGALLFWARCAGISEYWQYFRLQAFKGAYLSAPSA